MHVTIWKETGSLVTGRQLTVVLRVRHHLLRTLLSATSRGNAPLVRLALLGFAFGIALLSCGRDVTSPGANVRYARGIAWRTEFPPAYQVAGSAAAGVVDFNRVHVVLLHSDGTVALDTVIAWPAGTESETISLDVKLLPSAPSSGELLSLSLGYINAAGDTVFKGGPVGVTATPVVSGQPPPPPVTIPVSYSGPGASAVGVQITPRSGTVVSGSSFNFTAVAVDHNGVAIPNTPIVWNTLDPSIASIPSAASGTVLAGSVRGTARIVAQLLTGPTDQVTLNVLPRATTIALQSGSGQSGLVGNSLANPLVALVTAGDGIGVGGVTVTFAVASGGGSVGTATVVTDNAGLAQTSWKLGSTVGTQTVTASAGTLAGSPVTYTATARSLAAVKLAVTAQPANGTAGATLATVTIVAQTASGDTASAFTGAVTLTLAGGTSGATLGGTTTVNAVGGVATFSNLTVSRSGTSYSLVASSSGLTNATTNSFDIAAGVAGKLVFTSQPSSSTAGVSVGALAVTATDQFGNTVTGFTGLVTLAIASNPGAATIGGTTSANAVAGVATFGSVTLNRPGSGYTFTASATGLASATSTTFDVAVGAAANIAVVAGAGQSGNVSAALPLPIVVQVQDLSGNSVAGTTVNFGVVTGGGSVLPASGVSNAAGLVQTTWTLGATVGAQSISATSAGLGGSPLTINATGTSTLSHFAVTTSPPVSQVAGVTVTPGFVVQAQDASNNPISTFTGTVSLAIGTNPGGGTLSGTTSVSAVAGVATFNAFSIDKAGTGYTVVASAAGYTSGVSSAFNIAAGAASIMSKSAGDAQTGSASALLATPLAVLVTDANANPVAGRTINWAILTGGGSVATPTSVTNAAGIATMAWTLGATPGAQTVSANSAGLTGTPLTFTATASGGVASTTVTPHTTTITAIGATFGLAAQAKDGAAANVAGAFVWVSRNAAVATVSATGVVTSATNGTAYIVATETGGTKDSALVTVAQQLATISITPSSRNMHIGDTFTFTASAVDGLGVALSAQPAFTWATNNPSLATVSGAGLVTAIALGNGVSITATSGAVTGVASVNVTTRITRIVVAVDSGGSTATDVATLPSLGINRRYVGIAYDSANAVIPSVTAFNWASTNGSVANIDSGGTATQKARIVTGANGTTSIQATAQGFTSSPAASLIVSQVLAAISLTPAAATIAVAGSQPLVAHGLDANGRTIGTVIAFTYASSAPTFATVSVSGVVTGVAQGSSNITAMNGAITSNNAVITVSNTGVPAVISFGRDTLSVGRGSSTSIPIFLSEPNATAITINLAVADTFAFWSGASVVMPANQTSVNATLNGHNAGTTTVTASDGSAQGFATATAVLAVQATLRLTSGGYALNGTDQATTQVLMSDPSPAGGTFVTFNFSVPGKTSVSPNPAFIPAGQLAADIQILGVAAGSTNITPAAIGVNGTASSVTVYAPVITTTATTQRLGAGQYEGGNYLYVPTYNTLPIPITLTSSDTTIATVTPSITIPGGSYYAYYTISAKSAGNATVTFSSPGWTAASTINVISTTPDVGVCCGANLNTTSPVQGFYVYAEDSLRTGHYRTSSLVVHLASTDTTVLKVLDTVVTIAPGQYYNGSGRVIPNGAGGTAYLRATASGHRPDSSLYTIVGPKLEFSWNLGRVGLGQEDDNLYVYSPNNVLTPLVVTLTADTTKTGIPATVTIPAGNSYVYFSVRGKALGSVPIIASAAGYQGDTATYVVTTPRLTHSGGGTLRNFEPPQAYYVYSTDSIGNAHYRTTPLAITLRSTDTTIIKTDTVATILAGQYYTTTQPQVTAIGNGTAQIIVTAAGHTPDTLTYTVVQPNLSFSFYSTLIGKGQNFGGSSFYVYTPDNRATPLTVTFTQKHATVDTLSSPTVSIAAANNYVYFGMFAINTGTDTVIASAPGYLPDTAFFTVSSPKLTTGGLPGSTTTTNPPITVYVYATDSVG